MSTQPDLFGAPDPYGKGRAAPLSPSIPEAAAARDQAMEQVEQRAEADEPGFSERAKAFVLAYLRGHGPTPGEGITDAAIKAGIVPEDLRAFGPVYMALSRTGKIVKAGMVARHRGHGTSGGNVWGLANG